MEWRVGKIRVHKGKGHNVAIQLIDTNGIIRHDIVSQMKPYELNSGADLTVNFDYNDDEPNMVDWIEENGLH